MKKALLLGAALMFIASASSAQLIGLYSDLDHTTWYADTPTAGTVVQVYVFGAPTAEGMSCLELSTELVGDASYFLLAATWHPDVVDPKMGSFPGGNLGACWGGCKDDWTWLISAGILMQSNDPLTIEVGIFTGSPYPKMLTCDGTEIEAYPSTNFCINYVCDPINAVEESSWGAIKNLYE